MLYTINPSGGDVTGLAELTLVIDTLGIKNPNALFDASLKSSAAAALPELPALLMATLCALAKFIAANPKTKMKVNFFIGILYYNANVMKYHSLNLN